MEYTCDRHEKNNIKKRRIHNDRTAGHRGNRGRSRKSAFARGSPG